MVDIKLLKSKLSLLRIIYLSVFSILVLLSLVYGINTISEFQHQSRHIVSQIKSKSQDVGNKADKWFQKVETITHDLELKLSTSQFHPDSLLPEMQRLIQNNSFIYGITVAYTPYKYDANECLFAPNFSRVGTIIKYFDLGKRYDYTDEKQANDNWFNKSLLNPSQWLEPYYGKSAQTYLIAYGVTFYKNENDRKLKKNPIGIIQISASYSELSDIIGSLDIGTTDSKFLLTRKGKFVYHENHEYVQNERNISDVCNAGNEGYLCELLPLFKDSSKVPITVKPCKDKTTGKNYWLAYQEIKSTKWILASIIEQKDISNNFNHLIFRGVYLVVLFFISIFYLVGVWFGFYRVNFFQRYVYQIFTFVVFVSLYMIGNTIMSSIEQENKIQNNLENETIKISEQINQWFYTIEETGEDLEHNLTGNFFDKDHLEDILVSLVSKNKAINGISIIYEPYKFKPEVKLYAPYVIRVGSKIERNNVADIYDYSNEKIKEGDWYRKTLKQGQMWHEPKFSKVVKTSVVRYALPFWESPVAKAKAEPPIGIVAVYITYNDLKRITSAIDLGTTGYEFLLTENGQFVYHPIAEFVEKGKRIDQICNSPQYNYMCSLIEKLNSPATNKSGILQVTNKLNNQKFWMSYQKIFANGWTLVAEFPKNDIAIDINVLRHDFMLIIFIILVTFLLMFFILLKIKHLSNTNWTFVIISTFLLVIATGALWYVEQNYIVEETKSNNKIVSQGGLEQIKQTQKDLSEKALNEASIFIPTGLYIQSIAFESSTDVHLTGFLWQIYPKTPPKWLERGVTFVDAVSSSFTESYINQNNDSTTTYGWYFETTIREMFDYQKYPFDTKDIGLLMWHKNFDRNVVLIPDLESYKFINPSALPGFNSDIVLNEWNLLNSFFSYADHIYQTNMGIEGAVLSDFPEMYFGFVIQRDILSPFISNLLPFFAIVVLLFALLLILKDMSRESFLASAGGLLFTILLAHFNLRDSLRLKGVVYIENYYFVLYIIVIFLVINTFLYFGDRKIKLIHQHQNRYIQMLYWPVILSILFLITFVSFY